MDYYFYFYTITTEHHKEGGDRCISRIGPEVKIWSKNGENLGSFLNYYHTNPNNKYFTAFSLVKDTGQICRPLWRKLCAVTCRPKNLLIKHGAITKWLTFDRCTLQSRERQRSKRHRKREWKRALKSNLKGLEISALSETSYSFVEPSTPTTSMTRVREGTSSSKTGESSQTYLHTNGWTVMVTFLGTRYEFLVPTLLQPLLRPEDMVRGLTLRNRADGLPIGSMRYVTSRTEGGEGTEQPQRKRSWVDVSPEALTYLRRYDFLLRTVTAANRLRPAAHDRHRSDAA